jgi:tRNA1Val (adenine37-N6)-methyltransferase
MKNIYLRNKEKMTMVAEVFKFKQFEIEHDESAMKVGTDGVLLGAWVNINSKQRILDIGTGTGLIALMLAQRNALAQIDAIEIDEKAAQLAMKNVNNSEWVKRIEVINESIQNFSKSSIKSYDLIVSNPPFFSGGTFSKSQDKTTVRHTVKLAHSDLLSSVRSLLQKDGHFAVILPNMEGLRLIELAETYRLYPHEITEVYPDEEKKVERLLISFSKTKVTDPSKNALMIRSADTKDFSDDYKLLTKDFYLNF